MGSALDSTIVQGTAHNSFTVACVISNGFASAKIPQIGRAVRGCCDQICAVHGEHAVPDPPLVPCKTPLCLQDLSQIQSPRCVRTWKGLQLDLDFPPSNGCDIRGGECMMHTKLVYHTFEDPSALFQQIIDCVAQKCVSWPRCSHARRPTWKQCQAACTTQSVACIPAVAGKHAPFHTLQNLCVGKILHLPDFDSLV